MLGKTLNILLLEDNPDDVRLLKEHLRESDSTQFVVAFFQRLSTAQNALEQQRYDLALVDLSLPDSTGLETLKKMQEIRMDLPLIVLTGLEDENVAVEAVQIGAQDYLVKGEFDSQMLRRAIYHAIERHQLKMELQASEARLHRIIHHNADGIIVLNDAARVCFMNPAAEELFAHRKEKILDSKFEVPYAENKTAEIEISHKGLVKTLEIRSVGIDWEGQPARLISMRDVTARKQFESHLRHMATHDQLTGLPNRTLFEDRLASAIERGRRYKSGFSKKWKAAVMLVDLDDFKNVNDTFGHQHGDLLLRAIAERLKRSIRKSDTVTRLGGDEFSLIFENVSGNDDAELLARKVLAVFDHPFKLDGVEIKSSISLGVSLFPKDGEDAQTLLIHADIAMYQAKGEKNTFRLYQPSESKDD